MCHSKGLLCVFCLLLTGDILLSSNVTHNEVKYWKYFTNVELANNSFVRTPELQISFELFFSHVNFQQRFHILLVFPSRSCLLEDYGIYFQVKLLLVFHKKVGDTLSNIFLLDKIYLNQLLKIGPFAAENVVAYRHDAVSTTASRLQHAATSYRRPIVFEKTSCVYSVVRFTHCLLCFLKDTFR